MSEYQTQKIKATDVFTPTQIEVLVAIADIFVPSLEGEEAARVVAALPPTATPRQRELVASFAADGFKNHPELIDALARQAVASISPVTIGQIQLLLTILSTRAGTFALTGHVTPFPQLDRKTRTAVLDSWFTSPLALLNKGATGLKGVALIVWYRFYQPAWEATGYVDGLADDWKNVEAAKEQEAQYPYVFENDRIANESPNADVVVDTDVLIIGSGSGGGVAAQYLSQRGLRVLVAEKGTYMRAEDMKGREDHGYSTMYEGDGLWPTEDGTVNVLAGSTFGGGTTINWSASLKPRNYAREAWANKHGVPYYRTPAFSEDLNQVCKRMGCGTHAIKHNLANSLLALGAQRCGQPVEAVPQNTGGHVHYCGKCQLGCVSGHKQGGTVTWLKDTAETGRGAFMTSTFIERILFEGPNKRKAVGALAIVDGRKVTIRANRAVVVSAGSIQTPAVLLRSPELKYNTQIGKNLHLHPTTVVTGYYDFPIKPWEGGLLTTVSNGAELVDPEGWGCKIEVIASSPSLHAGFHNWTDAVAHKQDMLNYSHSFTMIVITRDRDGGRVFVDADGNARMDYTVSKHDQNSMIAGVLRACDIHMMAGASKIATVQTGVPPFKPRNGAPAPPAEPVLPESTSIPSTAVPAESLPRSLMDPDYVAWRAKVEKAAAKPYRITVGSAHQMGSCRLGGSPKTSALDPEGRVWGAKNLYVADASALPEASGVNPMITTMATARMVARTVASDLGVERPEGQLGPGVAAAKM